MTLFFSMIYQSSVRSALLSVSYEPEVHSLEDGLKLLDVIYTPHIKQSDTYPKELYFKTDEMLYGKKILQKVGEN